jgi:hypothetical protein
MRKIFKLVVAGIMTTSAVLATGAAALSIASAGPSSVHAVALNPQPLPPRADELNPQPLPPLD